VFLYGYWLGNDAGLWSELTRLRRRALTVAALLFAAYMAMLKLLPQDVPDSVQYLIWTVRSVYIWTALCAILGWSHHLLNRPLRWLPWATEAVYPWYVLHQSLIVLIAYWILPLKFGPVAEPAIVLGGTVAGCFVLHEIIRRVPLLRPCFGLKARKQPAARSAATSAAPEPA